MFVLLGLVAGGLFVAETRLQAGPREVGTVESSTEVVGALATLPFKGIPPALMQDAQAVAIIPNVLKAGFVFGGRYGRGVVAVRDSAGGWTNPVFISLTGGSFGWQIGVQSTDIVLVFKTRAGLDRILNGKGKLTLGADVAVAAGPVGRQAEAGTDGMLKAEIYSYSRSRGLFAGLSLEGAAMLNDAEGNEAFYGVEGVRPSDILNGHVPAPAAAAQLRSQLTALSSPPPTIVVPAPVFVPTAPPPTAPPPVPPPAYPPLPR
jgi:lipid-binding SYLF domain-containing protein